MRIVLMLQILAAGIALLRADDWPQFLGPNRDGVSKETIQGSWEQAEPKQSWKIQAGAGFAGPVVSEGTVILFDRTGSSEILHALEASTGREKWSNKAPTSYRDDFGFDEGPRAAPCIDHGQVIAMGAEGMIRAVDFKDGRTLWTVSAKTKFGARKGFFGMACSPLIAGSNVVINIGGENGAGIVALDRATGALRWKTSDDEAGYSSPVLAKPGGADCIVAFTRQGLAIINPATGAIEATMHWRSRMEASVNAATPLVDGSRIFLTASYGTGAALLQWSGGKVKTVWSGDESLSSHYATPVLYGGNVYGFHGRQEYGPSLRCIELATGKVLWSEESFGAGTLIRAGDKLLILRESGELVLADADPKRFTVRGRAHLLGSGTRAAAALSNNTIYARDQHSLVAIRLP